MKRLGEKIGRESTKRLVDFGRVSLLSLFVASLLFSKAEAQTSTNDWPQLGHDTQKSSASPQTVNGPYRFYWRWTDVPFASRVQPVVVDNRLFIGGLNGTFYAVAADADNRGAAPTILWQKDLKDPTDNYNSSIRSGAGVDISNNTVIVGTQHGIIYGLDTVTGNQKWTVQTNGAILASPAIANGTAYLGSADGNFYSIRTSDGQINWQHTITDPLKGNIPILGSAALSSDNSRVFFAAENVKAYGLNTSNGSVAWSTQLQGQSGTDRWPVVLGNTVVFRTQPLRDHYDLLGIGDTVMDSAGSLLSDWAADWNNVRPRIVTHLSNSSNVDQQTFFAFDANSGQFKGVAPVLATYGNGDPPAPPLVYNNAFYLPYRARHGIQTDGGSVHVSSLYDAELGRMDPATLAITGLASSNTYQIQFRMTSDEPANLSMMGDTLLIASWERIGGIKLTGSTSGALLPIAKFMPTEACGDAGGPHIPFYDQCPANSAAILAYIGLAEGALASGAVVASGRIFWRPEKTGWGAIGPSNSVTNTPLSTGNIPPSPGPIPSATPLADYKSYVWTEPSRPLTAPTDLLTKLEQEVQRIVAANNHLMPFYLNRGIWASNYSAGSYPPDTTNPPEPANVQSGDGFWYDPGELIYTLSIAYPYLNASLQLQSQLKAYLQSEMNRFPPLDGLPYCCTDFDWKTQGQSREPYPVPDAIRRNAGSWPPPGVPIQTIYALWAYAKYIDGFGTTSYVASNWSSIKSFFNARKSINSGDGSIDMYGEIAGAIGFSRIAKQLGYSADATSGENVAISAMQNGLNFSSWLNRANTLYPEEGGSGAAGFGVNNPGRRGPVFFGLTPEIGDYLKDSNLAAVDYFLTDITNYPLGVPLWYATRLGLQGELQENSYLNPMMGWSVFLAQAYIKGAAQEQLRYWLDRPWGLGDMWYLQKLVATIEAASTIPPLTGDVNQDTQVNVLDVQAGVNDILDIQDFGNRADVNGDSSVNVLDVQAIVNIILGV